MIGTRWNLVAGLLLVAVGCSTSGTVNDTLEPSRSSSTVNASTSTSAIDSTSSSSVLGETSTTLEGHEIDAGPLMGVSLVVIGVEHDDVLNVRAGPGVDESVLATAEPTSTGLVAQGRTRIMPDGALWVEVDIHGTLGWVHMGYVALQAGTEDVTALVVQNLGEYPTTASMREMGHLVASVFASSEPASRIVMVAAAAPGDMQDVTFDVIGLGDDAIRGYRVRVFAVPVSDGLGFHSAELTTLCARSMTDDGRCV